MGPSGNRHPYASPIPSESPTPWSTAGVSNFSASLVPTTYHIEGSVNSIPSVSPRADLTGVPTTKASDNTANPHIVEDVPYVRACRCNKRSACIGTPISKGTDLRLCLSLLNSGYLFSHFVDLFLGQENEVYVITDQAKSDIDGMSDEVCYGSICTTTVAIPIIFSLRGRPHTM